MKTAVVHDWLATYTGSERVLEQILLSFPDADLFTLVDALRESRPKVLDQAEITTSFIESLPFGRRKYRSYLPLFPAAIERFDLSSYPLVLTSSHAVAKGVLTYPGQLHICYLQSRNLKYAYDDRRLFASKNSRIGVVQDIFLSLLRTWDAIASHRPDVTIANSHYVATWHKHRHGINCEVIYPPVDTSFFTRYFTTDKDDYFVVVSRLEPYKRIDVVVEAFNHLGTRLIVIGDGSQKDRLAHAAGPNIQFLGYQSREVIAQTVSRAKAFIFPSMEDFGIAPVEAMACGTPIIAYGRGGALETVRGLDHPTPTGLFFDTQTAESLLDALIRFEASRGRFIPHLANKRATDFSEARFRNEYRAVVEKSWYALQNESYPKDA